MTPYLPNLPKKKKWDTGGEMHSDDTQLKNDLYLSTRGRSKTTLTKKGINFHFTYEGLLLLGKLVHQGRGEDEKVQNRVHVVFERPYLLM